MAFYFGGLTTDSASSLFSSLNTKGSSSMTNMLGDYYSIKNGSYKKLLTAYYSIDENDDKKNIDKANATDTLSKLLNQNKTTSTATDSAEVLVDIEKAAAGLKESANKLLNKSNVDETYSTDNIYDNVKAFVDSYNGLIDATEDTNTSSISKNLDSMIKQTKVNQKMLSNIGIEINEDNKLSLNKDKLLSANVDTVKSLLGSTGSYGYRVSASASMINFNAEYEASRANTYTASGKYSNNYNTGSLYDTLF